MFERGEEEKLLCINLLEAIKQAVIYGAGEATQAIFFVFLLTLARIVLTRALNGRSIMLKARSHEKHRQRAPPYLGSAEERAIYDGGVLNF